MFSHIALEEFEINSNTHLADSQIKILTYFLKC